MWMFAKPLNNNPYRTLPAWLLAGVLMLFPISGVSQAETIEFRHGHHPYGQLKYPADFRHFDYVNPNAPKGGTLRLMGHGDFDTLNPYSVSGRSPANTPGMFMYGFLETTDTLLTGASGHSPVADDLGASYGLIADSIGCPASLAFCVFSLRPEARFNDGVPITSADVVFSFQQLKEHGHPRFALNFHGISKVEALGPHQVKFHFTGDNRRHLPGIAGSLPVLPKHYWEQRDFNRASFEIPVISGPYRIQAVQPGRQITLHRDPSYWGASLPVNRGRYNFDEVIIDFYRDGQVAFEAFKSGRSDVHYEYISKQWNEGFNFPAFQNGRVKKAELTHRIAQGTQGIFINTRRPQFQDRRVRKALNWLFDFEWANRTLFYGAYQRTLSYFPNSPNAALGTPSAQEIAVLAPYRQQLPDSLFKQPFSLPINQGQQLDRARLAHAMSLLNDAGYTLQQRKLVHSETGQPLRVEILNYHNPGMERVIQPWLRQMQSLGIDASHRVVEQSQYKRRVDAFDYDVVLYVLPQSAFPGAELREYFHSESAAVEGARNLSGINQPLFDELVERILSASDYADYQTLLHALDRVLLHEHYMIPHWHLDKHRLAWWDRFQRPPQQPPYGLALETWWHQSEQK